MAYLDLMILLSRYVFLGFGLIFVIVAFSSMEPFISYTLGNQKKKHTLLFLCLIFFHIGATAILVGKETDSMLQQEIMANSFMVISVFVVSKVIIKLLKRQDQFVLWCLIFFLMDVGYIMQQRLDPTIASRQVGWMIIGMFVALFFPYIFKWLIHSRYKWLYLGCTVVLIFLPFVYGERIYGAINWVQIGPIGFQPSEIAKITFVMYLASAFHHYTYQKHAFRNLCFTGGMTALFLLVLVVQRDLGAALLYFLTFLVILYMTTKKWWLPALGAFSGGVASLIAYQFFAHVQVRVQAWIDPWSDIENTGYQVVQGLFAMGTWGFLGSGLTRGIPEQIPIVTTDYIFPAICEEFGNAFGIVVLVCYLGIIFQGLKAALSHKDSFLKVLAVGCVTLLAIQTAIIIGGVLKLIPLTGVTLPFVSYGGSSMLTSLSIAGIIGYLLSKADKEKEEVQNEG